jgi:hypothetical protein
MTPETIPPAGGIGRTSGRCDAAHLSLSYTAVTNEAFAGFGRLSSGLAYLISA